MVWGQKNIFRLELIPEYKVPADLILFEKWKNKEMIVDTQKDKWLKSLREAKNKGVKVQRVRITPLPIPEYIFYEIDYWHYSIQAGEEILFLSEADYNQLQTKSDFKAEDYWMFDDEVLVIFHYKNGDLIKEEMIRGKELIEKHREFKEKLLNQAILMNKFLKKFSRV